MEALRSLVALALVASGLFVTLVGIVWVAQVPFEPSYDTKDSTWTVIGLVILTTGLLVAGAGVLVLRIRK